MLYPKQLKVGDTIGIVCPSSAITEERQILCIKKLESMGFKVKISDNLTTDRGGYMAGTGQIRGEWLNRMFEDKEVDAIFCARGGDSGSRVMEFLNLDSIQKNPKIFVGYSDVTCIHLAILQNCNLVTFHGPMVSSNMVDNFDKETEESFFHAINAKDSYEFKNPHGYEISVLKEGKAQGILTGGNLDLLSSSLGTPYEVDTKGKILFIEEVHEKISSIERMIYQLRNSGKLSECVGILLGQFTDCKNSEVPSFTEIDCFRDAFEDLSVPVLYNIQSGHDFPMVTLPLGALCTIDSSSNAISFGKPNRE